MEETTADLIDKLKEVNQTLVVIAIGNNGLLNSFAQGQTIDLAGAFAQWHLEFPETVELLKESISVAIEHSHVLKKEKG